MHAPTSAATKAKADGARMLVCPELQLTGHGGHPKMGENAEPVPEGPLAQAVISLSQVPPHPTARHARLHAVRVLASLCHGTCAGAGDLHLRRDRGAGHVRPASKHLPTCRAAALLPLPAAAHLFLQLPRHPCRNSQQQQSLISSFWGGADLQLAVRVRQGGGDHTARCRAAGLLLLLVLAFLSRAVSTQ